MADGECGYLVDPRDVEAAADRVRTLLTDAGRRVEMGESGRERVEERFPSPDSPSTTSNCWSA